jgi:7-cyano-7-deazaguanine synthase
MPAPKAILLLSGGLDSTILLHHYAKRYRLHALSFDYGQKNRREIYACNQVAAVSADQLESHEWISLPSNAFASSNMLTGSGESAYIPARNLLFISLAANRAAAQNIETILLGLVPTSEHDAPDTRPEFVIAMERALRTGLNKPIRVMAPLYHMRKQDWLRWAKTDRDCWNALRYSYSCYRSWPPCGECNACVARADAFKQIGEADPGLRDT